MTEYGEEKHPIVYGSSQGGKETTHLKELSPAEATMMSAIVGGKMGVTGSWDQGSRSESCKLERSGTT
jgi:hypothetical protein